MEGRNELAFDEWYFLLTGGVAKEVEFEKPAEWMPDTSWGEVVRLSELNAFAGLREAITADPDAWKVSNGIYSNHGVRMCK